MTYNPVYPQRIIVEYQVTGTWQDISDYVVSEINGYGGFESYNPTDRVSYTGLLDFQLNNTGKLFSPMGGDGERGLSTLYGWRKGAKIRIREQFAGDDDVIWVGFIADIQTDAGNKGSQRVSVVCADWIDIAARYPMRRSEILVDATIDEAMNNIVSRISIQPEGTDFDTGNNVFPAALDNVKGKTKAISEMQKLALSELGYIYILKNGYLRVENSTARKGTRELDTVHVPMDYSAALLWDGTGTMNGNVALQENGNVILVDELRTPSLQTSMLDLSIGLEENFINSAYVIAYPTRVDTTLKNVFVLNKPIFIPGGATIRRQATYANPDGGAPINATNLQTPEATTDYQMWSGISGTGTDRTSDLTVTATYYGDVVDYELTNNNAAPSYITKLNARGYGIYRESTIFGEASDVTAIERDGDASVDIEQKYKDDVYAGLAYIKSIVEQYKDPNSKVLSAKFSANYNLDHMLAFTKMDVGDLISVTEERSMLTRYYYIIKRAFKIAHGGIITFTLVLAQAFSIASTTLNPVAVEFTGSGGKDAIDFGHIPAVSNLPRRSISAWIYLDTSVAAGGNTNIIAGMYTDTGGAAFYIGIAEQDRFRLGQGYSDDRGNWQTATGTTPVGSWAFVTATLDASSDANDPTLYINANPLAFTENLTPNGVQADETGVPFLLGNLKTPTRDYVDGFDGKIKDVRVYDRILSQSEITELYNAGAYADVVREGIVFQGVAVNSDLGDASSLNGQQIPGGHKFFDNVFRMVGTPNDSPLIREIP